MRRAYTLIDVTAALAILTFALILAAEMLGLYARQQQAARQLLVAQLEAANALEKIATLSYDDVTPSSLDAIALSKEAQTSLPGGQLKAQLESAEDSSPQHKQFAVEVTWPIGQGPSRSVKLTAWKYDIADHVPQ